MTPALLFPDMAELPGFAFPEPLTARSEVSARHIAVPALNLQVFGKSQLDDSSVPRGSSKAPAFVLASLADSTPDISETVLVLVADREEARVIDSTARALVSVVVEDLALDALPINPLAIRVFLGLSLSPVRTHLHLTGTAQCPKRRATTALLTDAFRRSLFGVVRGALAARSALALVWARQSAVGTQAPLTALMVEGFTLLAIVCHSYSIQHGSASVRAALSILDSKLDALKGAL
jgi:hypothetical protein